ncbi:hypothetical protein RN001_014226 [Aquatica leii]|uniref:BAG domain-containing protein n=1 Tax=Aquatica leii TaxID=1421715 RepID=A0AAN7P5I7_9COLE|nr:hypothetical protein RN001_014226 [Aquatica leii]
MGGKSSKNSYNVEKVGHGVKSRESLKKKEVGETNFPVDGNDAVIEEIISAVQNSEEKPRLSKEEQKKEEDLIIAKVRGEVTVNGESVPQCDVTPKDDKLNKVNDLDAITVIKEEISESVPIITVQNLLEAEKARNDQEENHASTNESDFVGKEMQKFESKQIEDISSIPCTINALEGVEDQTKPAILPKIEEQVDKEPPLDKIETKPDEEVKKEAICNEPQLIQEEVTKTVDSDKQEEESKNESQTTKVVIKEVVNDADKQEEPKNESQNTINNVNNEEKQEEVLQENAIVIEPIKIVEIEKQDIEETSQINSTVETKETHNDTPLVKEETDVKTPPTEEPAPVKEEIVKVTPKELFLQQILDVEKIINGKKEKILHFSGSAEDKEFSVLHEELIKYIIKLDDIVFDDEEVKTERRRVIKMIQQCVQNLERKIEQSDRHSSDSE